MSDTNKKCNFSSQYWVYLRGFWFISSNNMFLFTYCKYYLHTKTYNHRCLTSLWIFIRHTGLALFNVNLLTISHMRKAINYIIQWSSLSVRSRNGWRKCGAMVRVTAHGLTLYIKYVKSAALSSYHWAIEKHCQFVFACEGHNSPIKMFLFVFSFSWILNPEEASFYTAQLFISAAYTLTFLNPESRSTVSTKSKQLFLQALHQISI